MEVDTINEEESSHGLTVRVSLKAEGTETGNENSLASNAESA